MQVVAPAGVDISGLGVEVAVGALDGLPFEGPTAGLGPDRCRRHCSGQSVSATVLRVGISVQVQAYGGATEATCTHPAIAALCERARHLDLPMLGCVDPYDDTVFNGSQMRLLVPELHRLAEEAPGGEIQAAQEIIELTSRIERGPHRYLLFNGD